MSTAKADQIDAFGIPVHLATPPQRIVSLSPNLTEILFAIGVAPARIAGVTRYCNFPPQVLTIPKIGGIVDPSVEAILARNPDLVLATRGNPVTILDQIRRAGIPVFAFDSQGGLDVVARTMEQMARLVTPDDPARARSAIEGFESTLACFRAVSDSIPDAERPWVYYYDPASPDWTAGPGTHVSEAIALAGGRNVADDAPVAWPHYSAEILLVKPPDAIVVAVAGADTSLAAAGRLLDTLRERPGWRGLPAVRDGDLCLVPGDWLMRPGPRVLRAIRTMARCLHPDRPWGCTE